jgi:hypothetical protein
VALDDRYANKFVSLDSTTIYPKPGHKLLYSPMTGEMKCPIGYTFVLHIPFHLQCWCNTCTNQNTNNMIHFISSCDLVGSSLALTCFSPLPSSIDVKSCSSFTATQSVAPKSLTCPSRLQPVHQAKSCFDLLHLSHVTQCHVLYAMSSFITCVSLSTNPGHLHCHGMSCSHKCTCGLITCVSHI